MKFIHVNDLPEETIHGRLSVNRIISIGDSKTKLQTFNRAALPPHAITSRHKHNDCEEIFYFLKGSGEVTVGQEKIRVTPNDVVIVEPGEEHTIENTFSKNLTYLSLRILI